MDYEALLSAIEEAKTNAYGADDTGTLAQKRAKALEYYLGLNTNPAPLGRSQVVDRSVYETIQVLLPSLVKIFGGSSDEVCRAVAIGPDDEEAANQTTAALRHFVTEKNNWEQIVSDWTHDAMLMGNGYCMAYWEDSQRKTREKYEDQTEEQLAMILQDPEVKVVNHSQVIDEEATKALEDQYSQQMAQWQQQAMMVRMQARMGGQGFQEPPRPIPPNPIYKHTVVIERPENDDTICIKVLPPEHCRISVDTPDWTLNECPYFEFRQQKTIADIRSMGLEVDEAVNDDDTYDPTVEDNVRDRFNEQQIYDTGKGPMRTVWVRMIWIRAAIEKDKESRLYYVIAVGKTILYAEPYSSIPVASMTTEPLPHRHIGMSVAETVMDLQDIKQAIKRGALDNLYLANNGRHVISSKVNVDDFLDGRPGGVIRMTDEAALPGEGHVMPLVHPFSFDTIVGSLEYFDQDRQNRTGASRYFSGTDAGAINKTMGGTIALQNMASMRVEHKARMMAPGVESLFRIVWELISKHANKPLALKLQGKWTMVDPQAWRTKRDIKISVGVGAGNKESMMGQLQQVLASQMQVGLPLGLVKRENIHKTNVEILKLAGFANPEAFWPNPATTQPPQQPPPPEILKIQAEKEMMMVEKQMDAQKFQAEALLKREERDFQAQENEKQRLADLEKAKMSEATKLAIAEMNRETTLETTDKSQQFEAGKMQIEMEREDMTRSEDKAKEQEKEAGMSELLSNLQNALSALAGAINRPRIAVRDPSTGKPMYGRPMTDEEMAKLKQ